jgi:hypothetical protein
MAPRTPAFTLNTPSLDILDAADFPNDWVFEGGECPTPEGNVGALNAQMKSSIRRGESDEFSD